WNRRRKNGRDAADVLARRSSRHDRAAPRVRSDGAVEPRQSDPSARRMCRGRRTAPPGPNLVEAEIVAALTSSSLENRLENIVGAGRVRAPRDFEARAAEVIVEPDSVDQICQLVRMCEADRIPLAPI